MAMLLMDGWDGYSSGGDVTGNGYTAGGGGITLNTSGGRYGGNYISGANSGVYKTFAANIDTWWGGAVKYGGGAGGEIIVRSRSASGVELTIGCTGTGQLYAYRGDFGTQLGSTSVSTPFSASTWHWLEVRHKYDSTVGIVEVWCDGVQILNLTGQNTKQFSAAGIIGWEVGAQSSSISWQYDDYYVLDTSGSAPQNTRLGDCRIEVVLPTSDASPNNGTPSTGTTHYTLVDDAPFYNTTDYVDITNTTGQEERYGVAALAGSPGTVMAVQVVTYAEKTDAGTVQFKNEIVSGSSAGLSSSFSLTTSFARYESIHTLDPSTSAAIAPSALSSLKMGVVVQ
jgi:hypothetical protein